MDRQTITTESAPSAIGPYSQAVRTGHIVWVSGQIPLDPATGQLVTGGFEAQVEQAFANLAAVVKAAGGQPAQVAKLTLFVTDLSRFDAVNQVMQRHFSAPYPARSTLGVASLPRGAQFEVEAVLVLDPA